MTLRADIHSAMDQAVSPAPWLAADIGDSIRDTETWKKERRRAKARVFSGFRGAGALAAAMIVVILVVGALLGGELVRDWRAFSSHATPGSSGYARQLAQLRARTLNLQPVAAGQRCSAHPLSSVTYFGATRDVLGSGPVYASPHIDNETNAWGTYSDDTVLTEVGLSGPLLIRGENLSAPTRFLFVGPYASGHIVGHDTLDGVNVAQYDELVLDLSRAPSSRSDDGRLAIWTVRDGQRQIGDCSGLQFDGVGFSETITFN